MPTYDYACKACGHEFEREQRITEPPVKTCPKCRKRQVQRLISPTAFVLKGGGWYSDLYSSTRPKKANGAEGAEKSDAGGKKDAGADGKGAAKETSEPRKAKGGGGSGQGSSSTAKGAGAGSA